MQNRCQHNRTTPHKIKPIIRKTIQGARKTFKAALFKKTQLTSVSLLAGLMVVLTLGTPFLSVAQQKNPMAARATTEGETSAAAQISGSAWFILGLIGGPITVAMVTSRKPPVPAGVLLGKSPGYVDAYTKAYEAKASSLRFRYTAIGCVTGVTLGTLIYGTYRIRYNAGYRDAYHEGRTIGFGAARADRWW